MKKLFTILVMLAFAFQSHAQTIACQNDANFEFNAFGEAIISLDEVVVNLQMHLDDGLEMSYYMPVNFQGSIETAADSIHVVCEDAFSSRTLIVEALDADGEYVGTCWTVITLTDPLDVCDNVGSHPCDNNANFTCNSVSNISVNLQSISGVEFYAEDFAYCSTSATCTGTYTVAPGIAGNAANLTFAPTISFADGEAQYPVVLAYTESGVTSYRQAYLYNWANYTCSNATLIQNSTVNLSQGSVTITATDFIVDDLDCDVSIAIPAPGETEPSIFLDSLTLTCANVGVNDLFFSFPGETNYSIININVADADNWCTNQVDSNLVVINVASSQLPSLSIELNGVTIPFNNAFGYVFDKTNLQSGTNTLSFISEPFNINGISTLDLVRMIRAIIGEETAVPMQAIVADLDFSGYLGIADLITIRELILGIEEGENLPNYLFRNQGLQFPSDFNIFDFDYDLTKFEFEEEDVDNISFNFTPYKIGDWTSAAGLKDDEDDHTTRNAETFQIEEVEVTAGEAFSFEISYEEGPIHGCMFALMAEGFVFTDVDHDFTTSDLQTNIINQTELRTSFLSIPDGESFKMTISGVASESGNLIDMLSLRDDFPSEIVNLEDDLLEIVNLEESGVVSNEELEIAEVLLTPNPVHNSVQFEGLDDNATIIIRDFSGKMVMKASVYPGQSMSVADLSSGTYFVELQGERFVSHLKMIKL